MKNNERFRKHLKNVQKETNSSAVLNDVAGSEFEQYPGHNEKLTRESQLSPVKEVARNNVDGKTWSHQNE